jgi:hypothetical protein
MDEVRVRSNGLGIAGALRASAKSAAQRAAEAAHKRADPARKGEAHGANAIALERRKLRVQVVNPKPHNQRRIPSVEVRRAEHRRVSKEFSFDSQNTGWV